MDVEKQQPLPEASPSSGEDVATTDDETLGGGDKKELQVKKEAIKLIEKQPDGQAHNGDTKIKIMEAEKTFSGMTKDELMKYANDPFWVRLRWFMFILFWVVWLAMLIGAVMIIVYAPKCAPTEKLSWWQTGPLVSVDAKDLPDSAAALKAIHAKGVIYKVPADDTYDLEKMSAHKKAIEDAAASLSKDTKIIVDLVPNYVSDKDDLFLKALVDKNQRDSFIWVERNKEPNNWVALNGGSAWAKLNDSSYILSQFAENRYDLQMNEAVNKERLKKVIQDFGKLAPVCGFRLANTKHFIVNKDLGDEELSKRGSYSHEQYEFWNHWKTTYVTGLSDLLAEFKATAENVTFDHCEDTYFGSSNVIEFTDLYEQETGRLTVEAVPVKLNLFRNDRNGAASDGIVNELKSLSLLTEKGVFAEHQYQSKEAEAADKLLSEQYLFTFLLPGGVPTLTKQHLTADAEQKESSLKLANLLALRNSPSFTQGSFKIYQDTEKQMVGYTRVKEGSPGYLVVYNPNESSLKGNFNATGIETDLTVALVSENYKEEGITLKHKLQANEIPMSGHSVVILTFVQDSSDK